MEGKGRNVHICRWPHWKHCSNETTGRTSEKWFPQSQRLVRRTFIPWFKQWTLIRRLVRAQAQFEFGSKTGEAARHLWNIWISRHLWNIWILILKASLKDAFCVFKKYWPGMPKKARPPLLLALIQIKRWGVLFYNKPLCACALLQ